MQIQLPLVADVARAVEMWSAADARLAHLLTRYGDPAPALRHYGLVLWDGGNLLAASQALTGAAALRPTDARVWGDLAGIFNATGQQSAAMACATESVTRDPTQSRAWLQLGSLQNALGDGTASVDSYNEALALDDTLVEAWVGLGFALYGAKRFRDAIEPLREAVHRGKAEDPAVQGCLGQALDAMGDFKGAAATLAIAVALQPENRPLRLKHARAQFAVDAIRGTAEAAVAACEALPLTAAEVEKTIRDGFHILSAFEYRSAAVSVGAWRLARAPDDTMQAYLLAALKGEPMTRAPDGYIVSYFDRFADEFDQKLVDVLGYRVPGKLAAMAQTLADRAGLSLARVLDLGCGTGLTGAQLAGPGRRLTGVDLSPRMLDKARRLGCYETLVEAEVLAFLTDNVARYDLVVAADMLIYFGDLSPVFAGVARALDRGGLFALSVETVVEERGMLHLSSGRFAHDLRYVEQVAATAGLTVRDIERTTIRLDAKRPAVGALVLLTRD